MKIGAATDGKIHRFISVFDTCYIFRLLKMLNQYNEIEIDIMSILRISQFVQIEMTIKMTDINTSSFLKNTIEIFKIYVVS